MPDIDRSVRGAQGGYMLAKAPRKLTVGMILRQMEGSLAPVSCLEEESCDMASRCVTQEVWAKIQEAVEDVVDHIRSWRICGTISGKDGADLHHLITIIKCKIQIPELKCKPPN